MNAITPPFSPQPLRLSPAAQGLGMRQRRALPLAWALAGSAGLHMAAFASVQHIDLITTHRTDISALAVAIAPPLDMIDWAAPAASIAPPVTRPALRSPVPAAPPLEQQSQQTQQTALATTVATPSPRPQEAWVSQPLLDTAHTEKNTNINNAGDTNNNNNTNPIAEQPITPDAAQMLAAVNDKALADVTASKPTVVLAASTAPAFNPAQGLSLPKNMIAQLKGSGNYKKIKGNGDGTFQFKYSETNGVKKYIAQMDIAVNVLFVSYNSSFKSEGVFDAQGVHPLRSEEKSTNKSAVAITAEPQHNRVVISSQSGFQPYHPKGQDLLSTIVQLGLLVQSQPQWAKAGTSQDFTVYRPGGIKTWRFQSQGVQTVMVNGIATPTVYVNRVSLDAEPDYEDQQHLWLDPARHGLPVRIRIVKKDGQVDLTMTEWQE